ncbi:hypothetical protein PR048_013795 [Dryococelus australis]|uniref:Uncharacterized protein n=1 Tax=Dryococelus australis TaxID=614101 RepID=A0ABQ9HT70_9NEOP|nr:hypothetical protein PR048_013795 [Dryococelus australis]
MFQKCHQYFFSYQGNDNEFHCADTITSSTSPVVPELISATLTTYCLDLGHRIRDQRVVASLTDEEKYQWLKNSRQEQKRSFQRNWLDMYEWLAYSKKGISGDYVKCAYFLGIVREGRIIRNTEAPCQHRLSQRKYDCKS